VNNTIIDSHIFKTYIRSYSVSLRNHSHLQTVALQSI